MVTMNEGAIFATLADGDHARLASIVADEPAGASARCVES
jgi:hypothetical protein